MHLLRRVDGSQPRLVDIVVPAAVVFVVIVIVIADFMIVAAADLLGVQLHDLPGDGTLETSNSGAGEPGSVSASEDARDPLQFPSRKRRDPRPAPVGTGTAAPVVSPPSWVATTRPIADLTRGWARNSSLAASTRPLQQGAGAVDPEYRVHVLQLLLQRGVERSKLKEAALRDTYHDILIVTE
eukprot:GHVU01066574.1.p1 GENE.GHVU01066574.1~~GHVU01066574.1.p1  ORF type:complete len:183 (+),score=27.19 GHVU01066574.1:665-1213(+)